MMRHHGLEHLLGTLVAEKGAAQHEQRRDCGGKEITKQQSDGQQDQQFVAERPNRNLAYDRQFAFRGKTDHVIRRDGCVIDYHASRLCSRLGRLARDIVERGCRHLCDRCDIVEKTNQSDTHQPSSFGLPAGGVCDNTLLHYLAMEGASRQFSSPPDPSRRSGLSTSSGSACATGCGVPAISGPTSRPRARIRRSYAETSVT